MQPNEFSLIPDDTTLEAYRVQHEIYARMTPQERLAIAFELSDNVRAVAAAGVRRRHPDYTDEEVKMAVFRLSLGEKLFKDAFPDCDVEV